MGVEGNVFLINVQGVPLRQLTLKRAVDFFSIEKVFFQHQELFQHPKGVFSAPGVFSASTVFYQHLRCFSSTRERVFLQHQKGVF